jgi:hypothetical protein
MQHAAVGKRAETKPKFVILCLFSELTKFQTAAKKLHVYWMDISLISMGYSSPQN